MQGAGLPGAARPSIGPWYVPIRPGRFLWTGTRSDIGRDLAVREAAVPIRRPDADDGPAAPQRSPDPERRHGSRTGPRGPPAGSPVRQT